MSLSICAVSGGRADWGLLLAPLRLLRDDPSFDLKLVVTGSHLSPEFGMTVSEIEAEGFAIAARLPILDSGDDARAVTRAMGRCVMGFAEVLADLRPDLMLVLGDRYEILAAVEAALIARLPVAHLCGGDVTEGAIDDAMRHAMTKMSHLHFVSTEDAARRVRQLGEDPVRVHVTGSPGLDLIRTAEYPSREEVFARVGLAPRRHNLAVTFHPPTVDDGAATDQVRELLSALDGLGEDYGIILTGSNADREGHALTALLRGFADARDNAVFAASLGHRLYLAALRHVDAVVGNSSSGLYEAPSFKIPTINIGDRQEGRAKAASVIDCPPLAGAIRAAIAKGLSMDCRAVVNPYGDGRASERIVAVLKGLGDPRALLRKRFHSMGGP